MSLNLLEMIKGAVGTQLTASASKLLGESSEGTQSALGAILPALLGGMATQGATMDGATKLLGAINSPTVDANVMSGLSGMLAGGDATNALTSSGTQLLSGLFGDKVSGLTNAISSASGLKSASVGSLLAMVAPLVFGFMKNHAAQTNLNASGLMSLMASQNEHLAGAVDSHVGGALGLGPLLGGAAGTLGSVASAISGMASSGAGAAGNLANTGAGAIGSAASAVGGMATGALGGLASAGTGAVGDLAKAGKDALAGLGSVGAGAAGAAGGAAAAGAAALGGLAKAGAGAVGGLADAGKGALGGLASAGAGAVGNVAGAAGGAVAAGAGALGGLAKAGAGAAGGLASAGAGAIGGLANAGAGAAGAAVAGGGSALGKLWPWVLAGGGAVAAYMLFSGGGDKAKAPDKAAVPSVTTPAPAANPSAAPAPVATKATATAPASPVQAGAGAADAAGAAGTGTTNTSGMKSIDLPGGGKLDVTPGGFLANFYNLINSKDADLSKPLKLENVNFATSSATLTPDSLKEIEKVAAVMKAFPNVAIRVEGNTDNKGEAGANKALSAARAASVKSTLASMGTAVERVEAAGFGADKPIASNDTREGRAKNRRVDVFLTKK